jgi:putative tryptophan/tyrosine transport system substrate-binding protein
MDRRAFVLLASVGGVAAIRRAHAQGTGKVPRVGFIAEASSNAQILMEALHDLGHVQGRTVDVDVVPGRSGTSPRHGEVAAKFAAQGVDLIVAAGPPALAAAAGATRTIPIVGIDLESDPVAKGWVASLSRPGGNVTGIFLDIPEMSGKQLQFLQEAVPKLERVAVLGDPRVNDLQFKAADMAARGAGLTALMLRVTRADEIAAAVGEAARQRASGLVALTSPMMFNSLTRVAEAAVKARMATICPFVPAFAEIGGLLAYGPVFPELYRRMAGYVDVILKGGKPAELPIQRPEKFEFALNLKTARALKLALPRSLIARADQVFGQ